MCVDTGGFLQAPGAGQADYTAPFDGVLTSWSTMAGAGANQMVKLKVLHLATGSVYNVVAESEFKPLDASMLNPFPIRIPVHQGDVIGLRTGASGGSVWCLFDDAATPTNAYIFDNHGPDSPPGMSMDFTNGPFAGHDLNLSATLEPDADGDGYGDETQDACPTDPTTQAACQADLSLAESVSAPTVTLGNTVTFTITAKNNSVYNTAQGVSISDPLSSGLTFVSASGGSCSGGTCSVGNLAKGASATVTVVARATATGSQSDQAAVTSSTPDPNSANNAAGATTTVLAPILPAPFPGLTLRSLTLKVSKNGKVSIPLTCPAAAIGNCLGTDVLTTAGKVTLKATAAKKKPKVLTLGRTTFSIPAGQTTKVTIKLTKNARKLLAKKPKVKARQIVVSHDSRNTTKTSVGKVTLKR